MRSSGATARLFSALLIAIILILACAFPPTTPDDFEVHFGRPANGDVIMLGESMDLLANGSSSGGDVSRVLFTANGSVVGTAANRYGSNIVADYVWTPTAAGEYTLQVAAQRGSEFAYSPTITVCVLPFQIAPGHPFDIYAHGYEGDCVIPDRSESAVPGTPTMTTASASPLSLTYVPYYFDLCPDQTRAVSFEVYIDDPHDDVVFVALALQVVPALASRINSEATLVLTHVGDDPPYTKRFVGQLDMHIYLARSLTAEPAGEGVSGDLNWTARAFGRDGEILIERGPFTIPASPVNCDGSSAMPAPTATSTLELPTPTPASEADCPPGTYFAPATNRCIPIQIITAVPGGGDSGGNACQPPPGGCGPTEYWSTATCSCKVFE